MNLLEDVVGIKHSDLDHDEIAAIDRIKARYYLLTSREQRGSPTDIITDLSVAIAYELRCARGDTVKITLDVIDGMIKKGL